MVAFFGGGLWFEPDDGFTSVGFVAPAVFEAEGFDGRVAAALPPGDVPCRASWLVARLAALTETDPRLFSGEVEFEESGTFVADLLAVDAAARVVAKLQAHASLDGLELGAAADAEDRAVAAFSAVEAALLADPGQRAEVEVVVEGNERRVYGQRGGRLIR